MSERWPVASLGGHCSVKARIGWRGLSSSEYTEDGPFLIAGKHVCNGEIDWDSCDHITEFRYRESMEIALTPGDVILTKDGTIGRVARVDHLPGEATLNGTMMLLRPRRGLDYRYLFHVLRGNDFKRLIDDKVSGSSIPHIFQRDMVTLPIALPSPDQQQGIANVLDTLDATIRQTEAIIEKLKQVKQGLLHDLLTRGIDANGELRPPQSQAPHLYKDSPLGWIPRQWIVQRLADFMAADITYGIVQAGPHIDGGVPYIRTGDMSGTRLTRASLLCTSRHIADSYRRSEVRAGDIVMAIRATVGKVLPVPTDLDGANLTQGTARLAPNERTDAAFLLWAIRHQRAQNSILAEIKGTTFAEITLAALREVPLAAPAAIAEQCVVGERIDTCEERIRQEDLQRQKLQTLKSGLMDDLLTGRVRVTPLLA